jgi:hypothetical protein
VFPLSFALKWFCPFLRTLILPFLVTFIRLVYDLFVFVLMIVIFSLLVQRE